MAPRIVTTRARVLAVAVGVALTALWVTARPRGAPPPAPPSLVEPVFTHAFVPGRTLSYAIDYRSEGTLDARLANAPVAERAEPIEGVTKVSSAFAGTLEQTVVEARADGTAKVLTSLVLEDRGLTVGGRAVNLPSEAFAPLARGFVVEVGRDGAVRGFSVEAGTHPIAERLAARVLSFLQLVVPADRTSTARWEGDERDAIGATHARYSLVDVAPSHAGDQLIEKKVVRATTTRARGALGRLLESGRGADEATLAFEVSPVRGLVVEAAGAFATEQILGDRRVGTDDGTVLVTLRGEKREDVAAVTLRAGERERGLAPARVLDPAPLREAERKMRHEEIVARIDVPALVDDAIARPPAAHSREAATYADILAAIVDVSAEGSAYLEQVLLNPRTGESAFLPIARAFGEDGSAASQAVLARVVAARPARDPAREAAMFSLGHAEAPTAATVRLLEDVSLTRADPWAYPAWLYLGRVAGQLATVDPARGDPVVDRLVRRAREATDELEREHALEALGNAGSARTERELAPFVHAGAAAVRRAAVGAHRLVPTVTARDTLLSALATDSDPSVRAVALEGVLLRAPDDTIADAVADRVEHDEEESVKKTAASRLLSLCPRSRAACGHISRLQTSGDEWTRNELSTFVVPR